MLDLVRQHGDAQVQLTFIAEHGPLDAAVTVAATMTCLRLISAKIARHWEGPTVAGHFSNCRAFQVPNFDVQLLLPIVWGRPGSWGQARARHCGKADIKLGLHPRRCGRTELDCSDLLSDGRGTPLLLCA
ncbi:putative amino acid transporter [Trypanosoma cruzi]|nr:putative amino acid transporter [Trypanosoma cruzi]